MSTVVERPPSRQRRQQRRFSIIFRVENLDYFVIPLRPDADVAVKAFRFKKADGTTYDVSLNAEGRFSCDCLGFLKHGMCKDGRGCKHVRCLVAAGMMPAPASKD